MKHLSFNSNYLLEQDEDASDGFKKHTISKS